MAAYTQDVQGSGEVSNPKSPTARTQDPQTAGEVSNPKTPTARAEALQLLGTTSAPKAPGQRSELLQPVETVTAPKFPRSRPMAVQAGGIGDGIVIPGSFRQVTVRLYDEQGDPLSDANWVQSAGTFPTSARVTEAADGSAQARMWLMSVEYDEFMVLAGSGRDAVDYVWYQLADSEGTPGNQTVGPQDDEADLYFSPVELKGLYAGTGADFGGPLG